MKTYEILGLLSLLVLVVALPIYGLREPQRLAQADAALQTTYLAEAADLYLDNCALCHGPDGAGVSAMPPLSTLALAGADADVLYDTIAHAPHGTAMASWHIDEGGKLSGYQVESLVTLIRASHWDEVAAAAEAVDVAAWSLPAVEIGDLEPVMEEDPHECRACHEEPAVHADRFGLNCARCHNLQAWKPALLTKHIFPLDHGGQQISCQTCHAESYAEVTCYSCHDHQEAETLEIHAAEGLLEIDDCVACHPTGVPGEAVSLQADAPANGAPQAALATDK